MNTRRQNKFCDCTSVAKTLPFRHHARLVIKSFPEALHAKLRQFASDHRRSVTQETIHLIETAIATGEKSVAAANGGQSKWANRKLLPEYEALLKSGALTADTDCTIGLSEERDAR